MANLPHDAQERAGDWLKMKNTALTGRAESGGISSLTWTVPGAVIACKHEKW